MRRLLLDFFKKNASKYGIGIIFMFFASYIQTLFPKVLGVTIDLMKTAHFSEDQVLHNIFCIVAIALTTFICTFFWRNLIIGNARNLECHLREKLFDHFETLSPEFYSTRKTGDLIAYAINDISAVRMTFGPATAQTFNGLVVCCSSICFMLVAIDLRLTLLTLAPLPVVVYLMLMIGKKIQVRFRTVQENFGEISDKVQENIYGIRVIKSFVQEEQEIANFEVLNDRMMESNIRLVKTSASLSPMIDISFSLGFAINLILGGKMVLNHTISLGDFVAFASYLTMIMTPIVSIGRVITIFQRGMASLERLNDIFKIRPAVVEPSQALTHSLRGNIEIHDLRFQYPGAGAPALADIRINIEQGRMVGIVGKTGSGKSTFAQLLLKLYNVPDGTILFDGIDINDISLESLRGGIGFVPQDTFLFSATIKENIASFKTEYSDDTIEKASRISHIYDNIREFPGGFDTVLGERGVNLSGGQKQRIAIARAIIKEPSVLILDDALSAVDSITQTLILQELKKMRQGKTTIVISHRISAVADADEIIVLEHGRIRERGAHDELLAKGGLYYDIYSEQAEADRTGLAQAL